MFELSVEVQGIYLQAFFTIICHLFGAMTLIKIIYSFHVLSIFENCSVSVVNVKTPGLAKLVF